MLTSFFISVNAIYVTTTTMFCGSSTMNLVLDVYYILYSFGVDGLPQNTSASAWIRNLGDGHYMAYRGDVFIVKMAGIESDEEHGWAVYQDIDPEFLNLLNDRPDERKK